MISANRLMVVVHFFWRIVIAEQTFEKVGDAL